MAVRNRIPFDGPSNHRLSADVHRCGIRKVPDGPRKSTPGQLAAYRRYYIRNLEKRREVARESARKWRLDNLERARASDRKRGQVRARRRREDAAYRDSERRIKNEAERRAKARRDATATRPRPGNCEVCGSSGNKDGIVFDHCHKTGKFRGWLCAGCNLVIGRMDDDPQKLEKLAQYLRENSNRKV